MKAGLRTGEQSDDFNRSLSVFCVSVFVAYVVLLVTV